MGQIFTTALSEKRALVDFNKAIDLQPLALTYIERGVTLMLLGKDDEAEKDFSKVLLQNPEYKTMVENRRAEAKKRQVTSP